MYVYKKNMLKNMLYRKCNSKQINTIKFAEKKFMNENMTFNF